MFFNTLLTVNVTNAPHMINVKIRPQRTESEAARFVSPASSLQCILMRVSTATAPSLLVASTRANTAAARHGGIPTHCHCFLEATMLQQSLQSKLCSCLQGTCCDKLLLCKAGNIALRPQHKPSRPKRTHGIFQ